MERNFFFCCCCLIVVTRVAFPKHFSHDPLGVFSLAWAWQPAEAWPAEAWPAEAWPAEAWPPGGA